MLLHSVLFQRLLLVVFGAIAAADRLLKPRGRPLYRSRTGALIKRGTLPKIDMTHSGGPW
jgi:hypothetical protein